MRQADGQDVRHFQAPDPAPPVKPSTADEENALAEQRAWTRKRRGRSATIIAGLNEGKYTPQPTQKETMGA